MKSTSNVNCRCPETSFSILRILNRKVLLLGDPTTAPNLLLTSECLQHRSILVYILPPNYDASKDREYVSATAN